jgi:NAD(P)-dependent dehydrogenase (short-subunit alcohol dehydrogenase family)
MKLAGKVAIVTGGGSGMGLATARLLHAHGAHVVVTDLSGKEADTAAELGDRAAAFHADLGSEQDVAALIDFAVTRFGGLDILCNVAGVPSAQKTLVDTTLEDFDRVASVNVRSVFLSMKLAIPHMIARGGGSIVNVSSTAAVKAWRNLGAYSAAKAGTVALTKVAALEYGGQGIRANVVLPGATKTGMVDPARYDQLSAMSPLARMGEPEELASAILFLASDDSSFVTGAVLPVDGGQTA